MRGFRSRVTSFFQGLRGGKPIITTEWGNVSEPQRLQAAINMRVHPEIKQRVEEHLAKTMGGAARGLAEARKRYPEAYSDD